MSSAILPIMYSVVAHRVKIVALVFSSYCLKFCLRNGAP